MNRSTIFAGVVSAASLAVGAVAWTQVRQEAPPSSIPTPVEVNLAPGRGEIGALAQARSAPLSERLRGVLRQNPRTAAILPRIEASDVPVLAPPDPGLLSTATFVEGDRHYMLVLERGEQNIEIYGATKAFQSPHVVQAEPEASTAAAARSRRSIPALALRQAQAAGLTNIHVEQTEYGTDVSFNRFGAAYLVSFICEGQGAPGCGPADALNFAASLQLIGGGDR